MQSQAGASTQSKNSYNLKNEFAELIRTKRGAVHARISIPELEAIRTKQGPLSASKHNLEIICGASCDIGAQ